MTVGIIQKNNLSDKVEMLGYVNDPYAIHQKADAVLMCSKSEGMGRVTLEAMIFGNPVIGFNGGGTPELIEDGVDGFIYHTDENELAQKMEQLVNDSDFAFNCSTVLSHGNLNHFCADSQGSSGSIISDSLPTALPLLTLCCEKS